MYYYITPEYRIDFSYIIKNSRLDSLNRYWSGMERNIFRGFPPSGVGLMRSGSVHDPGDWIITQQTTESEENDLHVLTCSFYCTDLTGHTTNIQYNEVHKWLSSVTGLNQPLTESVRADLNLLKGWLTVFFLGLIVFMGCSLTCVHASFFKKRIIFHIIYLYSTPLCPFSDKRPDLFPVFMKPLPRWAQIG